MVLFQTVTGLAVGRLELMALCRVDNNLIPVCVVHCYDEVTLQSRLAKDTVLKLLRYRARPSNQVKSFEFILARTIIRGAVLVEDRSRLGDYIFFDLLDPDIFRRLYEPRFSP